MSVTFDLCVDMACRQAVTGPGGVVRLSDLFLEHQLVDVIRMSATGLVAVPIFLPISMSAYLLEFYVLVACMVISWWVQNIGLLLEFYVLATSEAVPVGY